ncbi:MAG: DUF1416 domain-containing protein [Planctomycetaceae bacterium]|nr:DUF1416 domain-containing protein [Planctomycetaceae bacterium]
MIKHQIFILCLCAAVLTIGCNRGFERCSVEGKVTWQGKPLDGAYVGLRPASGPGTGAETNAEGVFLINQPNGPMPGHCEFYVVKTQKVPVKDSSGRTADEERSMIPDKFSQKPKTIELKSGKNQIDLNLDQWDE